MIHTQYVDNFLALSQRPEPARRAAEAVRAAFDAAALPHHGVEESRGGEALGWEFGSSAPVVGTTPRAIWRLRAAISEILRRGACSGDVLRVLVGHFTMRALIRREMLSALCAT